MKKILKLLIPFLLPTSVAFAQGFGGVDVPIVNVSNLCGTGILGAICRVNQILNTLIPFLIALGVVYFIWGVVQYVIGNDEEAKTRGRDRMLYGILGFAVIIGLWGLVYLVSDTFGVGRQGAPNVSYLTVSQNNANAGTSCIGKIQGSPKLQDYISYFICIINDTLIPLMFAIATLMFIWGAVKYFIINGGEEEQRNQGKQFMLWGIVALAVMLSVWGLVKIVGGTFGLNTSVLPQVKPN